MIAVVLTIIFLMGMLLCLKIMPKLKPLELTGISFPLGFGVWSVLLFVLDLCGLSINNRTIILVSCFFILTCLYYLVRKKVHLTELYKEVFPSAVFQKIKDFIQNPFSINPLYLTLAALVSFILFVVVSKTLFWPIFNYDSINGYDLIAKVIGSEGQYNNSVFSQENPLFTIRSFYPPLLVHALSIAYIFGTGHSKIIAVIFLLSTVCTLYALVLNKSNHVLAILAVFLLCIVPEFMGQSALTASNPVAACYLLISLGFYDQFLKSRVKSTLILSCLALSFTIWTRTEAIIFALPMGLLLFNKSRVKQSLINIFTLGGFTLIPFIAWQIFIKTLSASPESLPVIKRFFFDTDRLSNLLSQVKVIMFSTEFYALSFYFLFFSILINLIFYKLAKDTHAIGFIIVSSLLLYIWVYYQIDTEFKILHQGSWIGSGFKRGLFFFLPIGSYYICCSYWPRKITSINN